MRHSLLRMFSVVLLVVVGVLASACSWDLSNSPGVSATAAAARSATPTPAPPVAQPAAIPAPPPTFATGSITRTVPAGDRTLVVTYWTAQDPATWHAQDSVVVALSAHLENSDATHTVTVTSFKAHLTCGTSVTTLREDTGEFVLTPPYSYGSALTLQCPQPTASATVDTEFDLLIETTPGSGAFFRQTVLDRFPLTFATKRSNQS